MINCHVICRSNSPHLSQIHTGLKLLHDTGEIALSQECRTQNAFDPTKPQHLRNARNAHLLVLLNSCKRLYFDCHDSFEIDEVAACEIDLYFKRSYAPSAVPESLKAKIFPLGLNYELHSVGPDPFSQERISVFGEGSGGPNATEFRPTFDLMHCRPADLYPRVLFITRAWDPFDNPYRADAKIEERTCINNARARCIELLNREFGNRFLGGFIHTDFAARNYPRALLPDNALSAKQNYIRLLREYPICVATTGLHGSNGWKMGEYVAFSRAIASERLKYEVPGNFRAGLNYLEFTSAEACVNAAHELFSDASLRYELMKNNYEYYMGSLKPDATVKRCIEIGLSQTTALPPRVAAKSNN